MDLRPYPVAIRRYMDTTSRSGPVTLTLTRARGTLLGIGHADANPGWDLPSLATL